MSDLGDFQDAFCAALEGRGDRLAPWLGGADEAPGLSVYRNTVVKGSVDALAATYETVAQLVGEAWFRAAAVAYVRDRPPTRPSLMDYGDDFADWLAAFPPAQDMRYLADVARLDRLWMDAYFAPDADPLPATALANLGPDDLARQTARLHPSARLAVFGRNIVSLWLAHRTDRGLEGFELSDEGERALVFRPALDVDVRRLEPAAFAFLDACREGACLLEAGERALTLDPAADLALIVAWAIEAGVFSALDPIDGKETPR